jgi:hypothetical protein
MTAGLGGATVGITKTQATTFANNNIRGVTGDNAATVFWGAGAGSGSTPGFRYVDASNNNQLSSTVTNGRGVEILNGQLFGTTGAGTNHGLYAIGTGQPTTTGQTATPLITSTTSSPYEFVLIDDPTNAVSTTGSFGFDTAYIADDSVPASGGGIQKYTWSGSAWVAAYTMNGGLTTGARGLAGQLDLDTNQVVLWTTSTDNVSLYQITDTGVNSAFMKIADAPTNTVFRGVALAPAPEPGSIALLAGAATLTGPRRRRRH